MDKKITLEEAARMGGVSPSTIYHWIKNGLLPRPEQVPNREKGRGVRAVYPEAIVESIGNIKKELKENHSIEAVRKKIALPKDSKRDLIIKMVGELMNFVKGEKYTDPEFEKELSKLQGVASVSSATVKIYSKSKKQE